MESAGPGRYDYVPDSYRLRCPWHGWEFDIKTGCGWTDIKARVRRLYPRREEDEVVVSTSSGYGVTSRFAVAAAHPAVVAAGLEVLGAGGNAVDAAVAAAFTAFVVEPVSAGLGGYGRLSAYDAETGRFRTVNHGPRAPLAATPDMFTPGEPAGDDFWPEVEGRANEVGARAVAVPGAVTGLAQAHAHGGRLRFADLLEPAIAEAERGIEVTWRIILPVARHLAAIRRLPAAASYLLDGGDPPEPTAVTGRRLDGSALAQTLRRIQSGGPGAFTTGDVAAAIARQVQAQGGLLTARGPGRLPPEDPCGGAGSLPRLAVRHGARPRGATRPCRFSRAMDPAGWDPGSAEHHHRLACAMAAAFVDGAAWYGDPDYVASPYAGLRSAEFAAARQAEIERAAGPPTAGNPWRYEAGGAPAGVTAAAGGNRGRLDGTTQVSVVDADGSAVALITNRGAGLRVADLRARGRCLPE